MLSSIHNVQRWYDVITLREFVQITVEINYKRQEPLTIHTAVTHENKARLKCKKC